MTRWAHRLGFPLRVLFWMGWKPAAPKRIFLPWTDHPWKMKSKTEIFPAEEQHQQRLKIQVWSWTRPRALNPFELLSYWVHCCRCCCHGVLLDLNTLTQLQQSTKLPSLHHHHPSLQAPLLFHPSPSSSSSCSLPNLPSSSSFPFLQNSFPCHFKKHLWSLAFPLPLPPCSLLFSSLLGLLEHEELLKLVMGGDVFYFPLVFWLQIFAFWFSLDIHPFSPYDGSESLGFRAQKVIQQMCSGNEFPPNGRNGFQRHLPFFLFFTKVVRGLSTFPASGLQRAQCW